MEHNELLRENEELKKKVATLERQVATLQRMLSVFENHPTLAQGIRGETLIADALNGALTSKNASFDIRLPQSGLKLEVKFSGLNNAVLNRDTEPTFRWAWANLFGEMGKKQFDRLILIGETHPKDRDKYQDKDSPYIFFDVPFDEAMPLSIRTNRGRYRSIQLSTDPQTVRSAARSLFTKYQVTLSELESRYGI